MWPSNMKSSILLHTGYTYLCTRYRLKIHKDRKLKDELDVIMTDRI